MSKPTVQILVAKFHSPLKQSVLHGEINKFQSWRREGTRGQDMPGTYFLLFFFTLTWGHFFFSLLLERATERGRSMDVRQKHACERSHPLVASRTSLNADSICNLGICLDQELNLLPFGYSTTMLHQAELHWPGLGLIFVPKSKLHQRIMWTLFLFKQTRLRRTCPRLRETNRIWQLNVTHKQVYICY